MSKTNIKLINVSLAAYTRVEYSEVLAVPEHFTDADIEELLESRWDSVDGGDFKDDPDYWEKGGCTATPIAITEVSPKTVVAVDRDNEGDFVFFDDGLN